MFLKSLVFIGICLYSVHGQQEEAMDDAPVSIPKHCPTFLNAESTGTDTSEKIKCGPKYPSKEIKKSLKKKENKTIKKLIQAFSIMSKFNPKPATSEDKKIVTPLPVKPEHLCLSKMALWKLNKCEKVEKETCWVHSNFWKVQWPYVTNCSGKCSNVTPVPEKPCSAQYCCRPTNYKSHYYYVYCVPSGKWRIRWIKLPQCCNCLKFRCPFKGR